MAKAYWVTCYRQVSDESALAEYARLAGPVIEGHGGRFLARGDAARAYEAGLLLRLVIIEFDSLAEAVAAYESVDYQAALVRLGSGAERDVRIVAGVESASEGIPAGQRA